MFSRVNYGATIAKNGVLTKKNVGPFNVSINSTQQKKELCNDGISTGGLTTGIQSILSILIGMIQWPVGIFPSKLRKTALRCPNMFFFYQEMSP